MPYVEAEATKTLEVTGVPLPWWEIPVLGIPLWLWLVVGGVAATGVGAYVYTEEQRRRALMAAMAG